MGEKPEKKLKRLIITKYEIYELPIEEKGIPIAEYFPGSQFPEFMRLAKVYQTKDGPVLAVPEDSLPRPQEKRQKRGPSVEPR